MTPTTCGLHPSFSLLTTSEIMEPSDFNISQTKLPQRFYPPNPSDTPSSLFSAVERCSDCRRVYGPRYIRNSNPDQIILWTDGACLNNGRPNPSAGCAFVYRLPAADKTDTFAFRLESEGPTGITVVQTSNRAELRAVIGALKFHDWDREGCVGWKSSVIATDSEYVTLGVTGGQRNGSVTGGENLIARQL